MKPRFISVRSDGLGSRLRCMLNSYILAQKTDGYFEFAWPDNRNTGSKDSLISAESIFSKEFLDKHYQPGWLELFEFMRGKGEKSHQYTSHMIGGNQLKGLVETKKGSQACYIPVSEDLRKLFPEPEWSAAYQNAFAEIKFSRNIQAAIHAAQFCKLPERTIAMHLRAGDIVETGYRFTGRFTQWVLPFPIAKDLINRRISLGNEVLIFGQDKDVIDYLCKETGAKDAESFNDVKSFSNTQKWFFETCLMARCSTILSGGHSAFSQLASWIGSTENLNGYSQLLPEQAANSVLSPETKIAPVSKLQRAFAFWALYYVYGTQLSGQRNIDCLELAIDFDPKNSLYKLALANALIALNYNKEACDILDNLIIQEMSSADWSPGCLRQTLHLLSPQDCQNVRLQIFSNFDKLAKSKNYAAKLCIALASNEKSEVAQLKDDISNSSWTGRDFFSYPLERKIRSM